MSLRKVLVGFGVLCATALLSSPACATFRVEIFVDSGGGPVSVAVATDGDSDGIITVPVVGSGYNFLIELATSNAETLLGAPLAELTSNVTVNAADSDLLLQILVSATDYGFPGGVNKLLESSFTSNTSVGDGVVEFQSWADANNTLADDLGDLAGLTDTTGLQSTLIIGSDVATPVIFSDPVLPFSLTHLLNITLASTDTTFLITGATSVSPVPEPGSLALLAMGGASLFGYGLRRRKAQTV